MRRMLMLLGSIAILRAVLAPVSKSGASDGGRWINPSETLVCSEDVNLPPSSICVEWLQLDHPDDGTYCCVASASLSNDAFSDCLKVVGKRGPRMGGGMD